MQLDRDAEALVSFDRAPALNRIRVTYLSADFHEHPTAYPIAELLERHDRTHFEVIGVSYGPDDRSATRTRIVSALDQLHDVRSKSDRDIAALLHELAVDIVVDLEGHTADCRPGILAHRPAPIAVDYLGFPGSMGADFIDYVIADATVLPFDQQPFFSEQIVHHRPLPRSRRGRLRHDVGVSAARRATAQLRRYADRVIKPIA